VVRPPFKHSAIDDKYFQLLLIVFTLSASGNNAGRICSFAHGAFMLFTPKAIALRDASIEHGGLYAKR
jgi:hypothetical protein